MSGRLIDDAARVAYAALSEYDRAHGHNPIGFDQQTDGVRGFYRDLALFVFQNPDVGADRCHAYWNERLSALTPPNDSLAALDLQLKSYEDLAPNERTRPNLFLAAVQAVYGFEFIQVPIDGPAESTD